MTAIDWTLVVLWVLSACYAPAQVEKPREPVSATEAVLRVVFSLGFIAWMLWTRLHG